MLVEYLQARATDHQFVDDALHGLQEVNNAIETDPELGPGFCIGHSYLCPTDGDAFDESWLRGVLDYELLPLLEAYYFDRPERAAELMGPLRERCAS